jgi:hypothetical protein
LKKIVLKEEKPYHRPRFVSEDLTKMYTVLKKDLGNSEHERK